jgi:hypothetical protein
MDMRTELVSLRDAPFQNYRSRHARFFVFTFLDALCDYQTPPQLYTSALPFFGPVPSILVAASGFVFALTSALTLTLAPGVEVAVLLLTAVPDLVFCDWARNFCSNQVATTRLVSDVIANNKSVYSRVQVVYCMFSAT